MAWTGKAETLGYRCTDLTPEVKKMGIVRSTFVIDPDGRLAYVEYGVTPRDHARKMLSFVKEAAKA